MSQKKTLIQGLEIDNSQPNSAPNSNFGANGFYSRSGNAPQPGTVVSGMMDTPSSIKGQNTMQVPLQKVTSKPVVGFLYSVSRTMAGEYWPLHIGSNTIGNCSKCDIVLGEGTVSNVHATLQIRRAKNTGRISAWISDSTSTNGTLINDTCLGSAPLDCKNGDIITVGDNYQLYLVLIDASALKLEVSKDFIPVDNTELQPSENQVNISNDNTSGDFNPWEGSQYTPTPGTIGSDGSFGPNQGGTIPL